ncbi:carboxymuconolactone decarboxylase family protein [Salisaeta longa]|uniref:carboxymuconolactone decarboxylase family protein n=1 Tax=Salisaeta longa TaxID=503170 RepID=UPI0003B5D30D|nr:carboxymuconolactone decarboxylase family protein [Salisaeta longa]
MSRPSSSASPDALQAAIANDPRGIAKQTFGVVPNFLSDIAAHTEAPMVAYLSANVFLRDGQLTPRERQVVLLAAVATYRSRYDAVVHARAALDAGLPPDVVNALLQNDPLPDPRLNRLAETTRHAIAQRGVFDEDVLASLADEGFGRGALYEMYALIGMKAFSCFANNLIAPTIDAALQPTDDALPPLPVQTAARQRLYEGA